MRVSTAVDADLPLAFAVAFLAEAFLPPLTLVGAPVAGFFFFSPSRVTTLVVPSLNCHSPHELARTP